MERLSIKSAIQQQLSKPLDTTFSDHSIIKLELKLGIGKKKGQLSILIF